MRHYTHLFSRDDNFISFMEGLDVKESDNVLVQVFCGIVSLAHIADVQNAILQFIPDAKIIGCTTSGEIYDGIISEHSTVMSISIFENTAVYCDFVEENNQFTAGKNLAEKLVKKNTVGVVCFSSGVNDGEMISGQGYIDGFNSVAPDIPVMGGIAADNAMFLQSYVFTENKIIANGIVGAVLVGKNLKITTTYNLGWRPIGKKMKITEADGVVLKSFDNIPVTEVLKKYFGKYFVRGISALRMNFPIFVSRDGINMARGIMAVNDDKSVSLTAPLKEGEYGRFSYGGAQIMLETCRQIISKWERIPAEAVFMFSCACRKWSLPNIVDKEVEMFYDGVPLAGFFSYGEFFHSKGRNQCLSYTQTLVAMKEYKSPVETNFIPVLNIGSIHDSGVECEISDIDDGEMQNIRILDHLVGVMNDELTELNELLEKRNEELQSSLEQIKQMKKLLPICSKCKKIRDDSGFWQDVEAYFKEHTDTEFSHGVCPECFKELYPDVDMDKIYGNQDLKKLEKKK